MELIKGHDDYKTREEPEYERRGTLVAYCTGCEEPIYEGDDGYIVLGDAYHKHCFEDEFKVVF